MKAFDTVVCQCGKTHKKVDLRVFCEKDAIKKLPDALALLGIKRPFILADQNTMSAAGDRALRILQKASFSYSIYVFDQSPAPDERAVGTACMHLDHECDGIVGVGSGVINDICKILSKTAKIPMITVATAPLWTATQAHPLLWSFTG